MCRMPYASDRGAQVNGHSFSVNTYGRCMECHPFPEGLVSFTQSAISAQLNDVKRLLDLWATTKAPEELQRYGAGRVGVYQSGRTFTWIREWAFRRGTAQIPWQVKKARYNLYLVYEDGSFGVHNAPYAVTLLDDAESWVMEALNQ